jgi:hypothetical protein
MQSTNEQVRYSIEGSKIIHTWDFTWLAKFFYWEDGIPYFWEGPELSGLDIETEGVLNPHDGEIATVQIALDGVCYVTQIAYDCIPFMYTPGVELLRLYLESDMVKKIIHNSKFELKWFLKQFSEDLMPSNVYCTQVGEYVLAEGDPRIFVDDSAKGGYFTLGGTIKRRFGHEMDKDDELRTSFRRGFELSERQLHYAAEDALWMEPLYAAQAADMVALDKQGVRIYNVFEIDNNSAEALARMELEGLPLNVEKMKALRDEVQAEIEELEGPLHEILDPPPVFVPGKPKARKPENKVDHYEYRPIKVGAWQQMIPALENLGYKLDVFVKGNRRAKDEKDKVDTTRRSTAARCSRSTRATH